MKDERRRDVGGPDPTAIRSVAVTVDDVVAAIEAAARGRQRLVLRITPPFYGRMRARIHREGGEGSYDDVDPIHLAPERFLADDAPAYPDVDETEDRLREAGEYDVESHREAYAEAVEEWRTAVRDHLVDGLTVETPDGTHEIQVKRLG
ncbi:hypothetical protein SAMN04487948_106110 [Halogranum amylolyticum]|uniref:DUF8009 domain-containing protein n=1 Tax=Halogranum amylolyticum TaxID=660520 RepID=A0A1H8TAL0_9EURY|nr:hypothetical protein [Halogranum amylolyticum]SEO87634.1 hypothetical protein SAMN04487948_106110 [Halogranum amylolyticum]